MGTAGLIEPGWGKEDTNKKEHRTDHDSDHHEAVDGHHELDQAGEDHQSEDHAGHADSYLTWAYLCSEDPQSISVALFSITRLERILVQAIGATGARAATLTADDPEIDLP